MSDIKVTLVDIHGAEQLVSGAEGQSLMSAAIGEGIDGIVGQCGGACSCATCHIYIDDAWRDIVGTPESLEDEMLDFASDRQESSRLSCQIKLTPALNGLRATVADN